MRGAGGSGITPMQQLVEEILRNPDDKTQVTLMFANNTEKDILLRERFDELASKHSNFDVHYVLTEPPEGWTGGSGHIDQEDIKQHCPPPGDDNLICVRHCPRCGRDLLHVARTDLCLVAWLAQHTASHVHFTCTAQVLMFCAIDTHLWAAHADCAQQVGTACWALCRCVDRHP